MSELREKLLARTCPRKAVDVDGDTFWVYGLSRRERAEAMAECSNGSDHVDANLLERILLCKCVRDANGDRLLSDDEQSRWDDLPANIVAPLVSATIEVNGLDAQDRGEKPEKK